MGDDDGVACLVSILGVAAALGGSNETGALLLGIYFLGGVLEGVAEEIGEGRKGVINPLFPASDPAQRLAQGLPKKQIPSSRAVNIDKTRDQWPISSGFAGLTTLTGSTQIIYVNPI